MVPARARALRGGREAVDNLREENHTTNMQNWISILWPSFLMSIVATVIPFLWLDPLILEQLGGPAWSVLGYYSVTFFFAWLITGSTALLTCYFRRSPDSFNDRLPGSEER